MTQPASETLQKLPVAAVAPPNPLAVVSGVVSSLVGWVANPFAGKAPAIPGEPPALLGLLAWARRQLQPRVATPAPAQPPIGLTSEALTTTTSTPPPIDFSPTALYPTGAPFTASLDSNGAVAADFDGDGHTDVAMVAPWQGAHVRIMYGTGTGSFESPGKSITANIFNSNVIAGDFNGDERTDLAVTGAISYTVLINDGDRQFHVADSHLLLQSPFQNSGVTHDFNGDGILDLALKTPFGIRTELGNGNGTFRYGPFSPIPWSFPGGIASIDVANLNGDGIPDLVAADAATQQVSALQGRGDGKFKVISQSFVPLVPTTTLVGDLNHSGIDSVVVLPEAGLPWASAAVLINDGTGRFMKPVYYPAGFLNPNGVLGDFNGDGNLDVVSNNTFTGDMVVLAGVGDGTFAPAGTFHTNFNAQTPVVGDFNEDGRDDFAIPTNCKGTGAGSVCLAVLISTTPHPAAPATAQISGIPAIGRSFADA